MTWCRLMDKYKAILKMKPWTVQSQDKGTFPQVVYATGLVYSDGSGDVDQVHSFTVNAAACPFDAEKGINSQTHEAIELYAGLIGASPVLYKALDALLDDPDNFQARKNAAAALEQATSVYWPERD